MTRIADSAIETVRSRVDIEELVREYVPQLKRAGRNWKACCPFHQEKTPSFMVNPEKQIFHCFGCGQGGDAFAFLMKMDGLSFTEAIRKLAERAGVQIAPTAESLGPREREMLRLREALVFAQEFYHKVLATAPEADAARRYLGKRGVNAAANERFGLGFALLDGSSFLQAALRKGYVPELLAKAGLVVLKEDAGRYRDYFRGRILYPIRNARGETAGFGARAMGDVEPKYLNSPDTAMFSKGRVLYGLFEGLPDIRKARRVMLMEGYMDVIAAHQFGLTHACAPLGTAVTPEHADLLKRYADQIVIVFDPDNAGAAASLRGAEILLERGLIVRIATVPDRLDPDELLHQRGVKEFEACIEKAQDLPDFQTARLMSQRGGAMTSEHKAGAAQEILATILKAPDEVLKREWVRRLAQRLQVDEAALLSQMEKMKSGKRPASARPYAATSRGAAAEPKLSAVMPAGDRELLATLFGSPEAAADPVQIAEADFDSEQAIRIFARFREMVQSGAAGAVSSWSGAFLKSLAPEDAAAVGGLLVGEVRDADADVAEALKKIVRERRLIRRYRELRTRYHLNDNDGGTIDAGLAQEYQQLLKQLSDQRLLDRV